MKQVQVHYSGYENHRQHTMPGIYLNTSIVEAATNEYPEYVCCTDIGCKKCDSSIITELRDEDKEILWGCGDCEFDGTISEWQGTKWDHRDKWNF